MSERSAVQAAMRRLLAAGASVAESVLTPGAVPLHHLEAGAGRPVVLLHGGSGGGANWFRVLPSLASRFRVLAPDLPGFGLSDPGSPAAPLGAAAADVLHPWLAVHDVRDALLVGTSFGGLAALRLAQRVPDRVSALLLLDSAGLGREIHPLVRLATLPGLTRLGVRPSRHGTAALFRILLTSDRSTMSDEQQSALIEYLYTSAAAAGTAYLADTLRYFAGPGGQREVLTPAELSALPQPTTFAWGALDTFLPAAHAHRAAGHCRDSRVMIVPDAGHSPNWERPAAVVDAILELARRAA